MFTCNDETTLTKKYAIPPVSGLSGSMTLSGSLDKTSRARVGQPDLRWA